jgi:tRNA pseudouridine55 synthase
MELPVPALTEALIDAAMDRFRGDIEQVPPMFSALKHEGRPLYEWARQGITIPRKARPVSIYRLELLAWDAPRLRFRVECSKGTYIRTLCEDLASALDTVGHLTALRRLRVGPFAPECMVTLERLQAAASEGTLHSQLLPVDAGLAAWPQIQLDESGAQAFCNGNPAPCAPSLSPEEGTKVLVRDAHDEPLGIGEISAGAVQPRKVFVFEPGAIRGTRELPENLENPAT